jgi:hypothetical protein
MWDLWWEKWRWGRFSPSTSVSPANSHYTNCSIHHHTSTGAGAIGQLVADVPSGLSLTPPQETKKIKISDTIPFICLEGLGKITKNISLAGVPAKILIEHFPNMGIGRYRCANSPERL